MLNGHLVEQVGQDREAMSLIKLLSDQPSLLGVMRHLVDGTFPEYDAKVRTVIALSSDAFLRGFMENLVRDADRAAVAVRAERRPNGLLRAVSAVIDEYGTERTFTTRDVVRALEGRGHAFVGRLPRQSVYFALRTMEKTGHVEIVIRGRGRLMNTYRACEGMQPMLYQEEVIHAG